MFTSRWRGKMALKICLAVVLWCSSPTVFGQTKTPTPNSSANTQQWQQQVADLRAEILRLQQKMEGLETTLKVQEYQLKQKQDRQDSIALNLTDHTFQRLDTDNGFFLISVEEAVPYLNGYKLKLKVGNPSYASYSAAKITVRWKKQYDFGKYTETSFDEWTKSGQERETLLTDVLDAGSWNNVELILSPATTEQLGTVTLSMSTETVRLNVK